MLRWLQLRLPLNLPGFLKVKSAPASQIWSVLLFSCDLTKRHSPRHQRWAILPFSSGFPRAFQYCGFSLLFSFYAEMWQWPASPTGVGICVHVSIYCELTIWIKQRELVVVVVVLLAPLAAMCCPPCCAFVLCWVVSEDGGSWVAPWLTLRLRFTFMCVVLYSVC